MITLWFLIRKGSDLPWYAFPLLGTVTNYDYTEASSTWLGADAKATWAGAHDATSADAEGQAWAPAANGNYVHSSVSGGLFYVRRPGLTFDTSGLDDGATISAATLNVYSSAANGADSDGYDLVLLNIYGLVSTPLAAVDFNDFGTTSIGSRDLTDLTNKNAVVAITISTLTAINKTGNTYIGMRMSGDIANSTPTGPNVLRILGSAGGGDDPYVAVTYTSVVAPTVTPQNNLAMLGVS
jgi:hypothetical protein